MIKKFVVSLSIGLLLLTSCLTVFASEIPKYPAKPKPLTDPSQLVGFNLDEINIASPKNSLFGKIMLPERSLPHESPNPDRSFGTKIKQGLSIAGVYAGQEVVANLELGSGEDRTLYAPTLACPNSCPLESVTAYWRYNGYASTVRAWGCYNHTKGGWELLIYFNNFLTDFVRSYSEGSLYFTEVIKLSGIWRVALYNFTAGRWQEMCTTSNTFSGRTYGWDVWESYEWNTNWPDPFYNVESSGLQVYTGSTWYYCPSTYGEEWNTLPDNFAYSYGWYNNFYHWYVGP